MLLKSILTLIIFSLTYLLFLAYPIYQAIERSKEIIADTVGFEQHPLLSTSTILVAGDSTAWGVGAKNNRESTAGRLGQQFPQATIINLGKSGARLKDLLCILNKQRSHHYNLILLQIGANDITNLTTYQTIETQISEILYLCHQMSNKTILLTAGNIGHSPVFRWPLSILMTHRTLKVRAIFMSEVAKYSTISYVDLINDLKNESLEADIEKYYAADLFHLTGAGYGAWYYYIQKKLE